MKLLLLALVLFPSVVIGATSIKQEPLQCSALPPWPVARTIMKECYDGWNVVVTVQGGLQGKMDKNQYSDTNVYSIVGEQNQSADNLDYEDGITVTQQDTSWDNYTSDKAMDADYSRDRVNYSSYVGVFMTVPLYSRSLRLKRKEATNKQIEHIADLYAKHNGHRATVIALNEQQKILRKVMIDSGQQGITAYYQLLKDIEKSKALMIASRRKIYAILRNCGYVEKN